MKSPDQVREELEKRLRASWSAVVVGAAWSPRFTLGTASWTVRRIEQEWAEVFAASLAWDDAIAGWGPDARLERRPVSVFGAAREIPRAVEIATIEAAARILGGDWPERIARGRDRSAQVTARFPQVDDLAAVVRTVDAWSDADVEVLLRAGAWFRDEWRPGLTARQVPVLGMGSKWLSGRTGVVARLAGRDDLGLEPGRPARFHLTYLDPDHLAAGGRRHDVHTAGDAGTVAYRPRVVLISENRDTAQGFPPLAGGVAIEGEGKGAQAIAGADWVREAHHLLYWGDLDAAGLEILHEFRAAGLPITSILMDLPTYERYERFGVDHDHAGAPLRVGAARELPLLAPNERELYEALTSPDWSRHRRIEQERIPLAEAHALVQAITRDD